MSSAVILEVFGVKDDSQDCGWGSDCGCVASPTMWQMYNDLVKYIKSSNLKGKVKIKFIDIINDNIAEYPTAINLLRRGYSVPLVMINGNPKFQGEIPYKAIYNEIEKYLPVK